MADRIGDLFLTDENGNAITTTNPLPVDTGNPADSTVNTTNEVEKTFSTSNQEVYAANPDRKGGTFQYEGDDFCVLRLGAVAAATGVRLIKMKNLDVYELPPPIWTGQINVIMSGTTGSLYGNEF